MGESLHGFSNVVNSVAVESVVAIDGFVGATGNLLESATVRVTVADGLLTLDPTIGQNAKIVSAAIVPVAAPGSSN